MCHNTESSEKKKLQDFLHTLDFLFMHYLCTFLSSYTIHVKVHFVFFYVDGSAITFLKSVRNCLKIIVMNMCETIVIIKIMRKNTETNDVKL